MSTVETLRPSQKSATDDLLNVLTAMACADSDIDSYTTRAVQLVVTVCRVGVSTL